MGFLLLWVWCCWSCFLLRALGARLLRMSISGVRMCERVCACASTRDTYAGIGHAGYRGHKYPLTTPKNRVLTPQKRGYIYIFIYFLFNGHQRSRRAPKTPSNTSSFSAQVLSL